MKSIEQHLSQERPSEYVFSAVKKTNSQLSKVQYYRLVKQWIERIGLDVSEYGTHSLRRTRSHNPKDGINKQSIIYRNTFPVPFLPGKCASIRFYA